VAAARQLALDLPARPALDRAAFFVAPSNALALAAIDTWPDWPDGRLAVVGPEGAGKTHLAHVWAAGSGAVFRTPQRLAGADPAALPGDGALVVEDADRIADLPPGERGRAEEALFHLCNRLRAGGGSLMLSGRTPPAHWSIELPDLASRLGTAAVARLDPPDDTLLAVLLVKLFADRQIEVGPDLIDFVLPRMDRSFAGAEAVVARLDRAALAGRRRVTLRLAAEVMRAEPGP
jgi:chromosomal replication initiation ATPase DnaA